MPWTPVEGQPFPSLGPLVAAWIEDNLVVPDGTYQGTPLRLSDDQYWHIFNLLRLKPSAEFDPYLDSRIIAGRSQVYNQSLYSRPKGAGKSPILGALCWAAFKGPILFAGWDAFGQPMGKPHPSPVVSVLGASEASTVNIWAAIQACADDAPLLKNYPDLMIGKTYVRSRLNKSMSMEFGTTSSDSMQGRKSTFGVIEESALLNPRNGGLDAANTLLKNAAKVSGTIVQISNAYVPGEESIFEATHVAVQMREKGLLKEGSGAEKIYFDHREAPLSTDITDYDQLMAGLTFAYSGSEWVDLEGILGQVWNPQLTEGDVRRFFLNQITSASDAWLTPDEIAKIAKPDVAIDGFDEITLGFDGAVREDATALVGCRVSDGHIFLIACWEKPEGVAGNGWEINREAVDTAVTNAFERYNVVGMFADPAYWSDYIDKWAREHGGKVRIKGSSAINPFYWQMNRNTAVIAALDRFHNAIIAQTVTFDGNKTLEQHLRNCRRRPSRAGMQVAKEKPTSPRKIDAAMAAVLAYACAAEARSAPAIVPDGIWRIR